MKGGSGNDTYIVDNILDRTVESAGGGDDLVKSSVTFGLDNFVEFLTLTGSGNINGTGNALNNVIIGNSGNNVITGGFGGDTLTGGGGNDTFAYTDRFHSSSSGGVDTIMDFASGDKIDLSGIDANTLAGGNNAFSYVGSAAFSGIGQLRAEDMGGGVWQVQGDVNGDGVADVIINVHTAAPLVSGDFTF